MRRFLIFFLLLALPYVCFGEAGWEGQFYNQHTDQEKTVPTDGQLYKWDAAQNLWVLGTDTDSTYTASGTLLNLTGSAFSLKEGTLTTTKGCKYVSGTGLVCDQDYLTAEVDGSTTNEINTITLPNANVTAGLGITFAQSGPIAITESAPDTVTFTVTETDPIAIYTSIPFTFKPLGGNAILNTVLNKTMPFAGTITGWRVASPTSSSITIQVNKSTTASPDERTYAEISGTEDIVLSTAFQNQDLSLSSWTATFAKGDTIQFQIISATSGNPSDVVQGVLYVTKTGS